MPPYAPLYPGRYLPASPPHRTRRSGGPSLHAQLPVEPPFDVLGPAGGGAVEPAEGPAAGLAAAFAAFGPLPPAPPDVLAVGRELQREIGLLLAEDLAADLPLPSATEADGGLLDLPDVAWVGVMMTTCVAAGGLGAPDSSSGTDESGMTLSAGHGQGQLEGDLSLFAGDAVSPDEAGAAPDEAGTLGGPAAGAVRVEAKDGTRVVTREDLRELFPLSMLAASERLGIGKTLFKKLCRKLGVGKWPYRKIQSIDKLIAKVRAMPSDNSVGRRKTLQSLEEQRHQLLALPDQDLTHGIKALRQYTYKLDHKGKKRAKKGGAAGGPGRLDAAFRRAKPRP